ncbi:MAG: hypothetical protein ABW321_28100 [Polyangiales bacterium]
MNKWTKRRSVVLTFVLFGLALGALSCAQLNTLMNQASSLTPPKVALKQVTLAQAPSEKLLTAHFCPRVLDQQFHMGIAGELACSQFFGRAPDPQAMKVVFEARLSVANPNRVPLPLSSVLVAVNVFPGAQQSELGATCVSLCSPDDPQCGRHDANACPSNATDVTKRADVERALGRLVIAEGARLATGQPLGIKPPQVLAGSELEVVVRLALDPQQLLPVLEQFAKQAAGQLREGKQLSLAIPYQLSGNVFTGQLGTAGVLSAPFGPIDGRFELH